MKERIFSFIMISAITGSLVLQYPYRAVSADEYEDGEMLYDFPEDEDIGEGNEDEWSDENGGIDEYIELTQDDVTITPSSKKLSIGSKFKISVIQSDPEFWDEYDEEIWEMAYEDSISNVEYKSKKPYIAKVDKHGVVKGRHKGTTKIVTTVYFKNGEVLIKKTTVRVTK